MWTLGSCLATIFLGLTFLVATLALRSVWKSRNEPPFTPLRIVLPLLLIVGGGILAILLRADGLLIPMIGGVFLTSVGWLIAKGM
jgi:hypothetical protein